MWRAVQVNARVRHPVDRVFGYLADPCRWPEFAPAVVRRRRIDDGPIVIGSRWRSTDRIGPFRLHFVDELVEIEANRRVVWHSSAPWNARTEYLCEPDGGETRIRARYEGDISGWLRLLGLVPPALVGRVLAEDFRWLQVRLDAEARIEPLIEPVTSMQ